jgi:hypothetical protein
MKPELKAFRYYRKNIDFYLTEMEFFWGDDKKLTELYHNIASKFGGSGEKLEEIVQISYQRGIERSFR